MLTLLYTMSSEASRWAGDLTSAEAGFRAAIEVSADGDYCPASARLGLGIVLGRQGRYQEAVAALELVSTSRSEKLRSQAALYTTLAYLSLGDVVAARRSRAGVRPGTLTTREVGTLRRMSPLMRGRL